MFWIITTKFRFRKIPGFLRRDHYNYCEMGVIFIFIKFSFWENSTMVFAYTIIKQNKLTYGFIIITKNLFSNTIKSRDWVIK
jgi:hypothetical protein